MPRKPSQVKKIVAQRKTICKECGREIRKGEELWLVGVVKRLCLSCYNVPTPSVSSSTFSYDQSEEPRMNTKRAKGMIMFDPERLRPRRRKRHQTTTKAKGILEPKYDEEGRLVCPQCNSQKNIHVIYHDYNNRTAKYYFLWECKACKVQFEENLDRV